MKNKKTIYPSSLLKSGFVMMTFVIATSGISQAQINLNQVKNKAKDKVVNSGSNSSSNTNTNNTSSGSSNSSSVSNSSTNQTTYTPADAPEAKKAEALMIEAEALVDAGQLQPVFEKMREAYNTCPKCEGAEELKTLLQAQGQLGEIEDAKYKCNDLKADNGVSSATHTAYMKKIVFSKTEIVKGKENPASFSNSFSSTDNIYSRIYIEKSRGYEAKSIGVCYNANTYLRYTIDDGKFKFSEKFAYNTTSASCDDECMNKWTTWQIGLSPSADDVNTGYPKQELQDFYARLSELPAGTHNIKIELVFDIPDDKIGKSDLDSYMYTTKFGAEKILATGEFNLTVKEADKATVKKKLGAKSKEEIEKENEAAFQATMQSSGSSGGCFGSKRISEVYIENQTSSNFSYSIMGDGASLSGSVWKNQKERINCCPYGYDLYINNQKYMTITKAHEGQTIIVR